MYRKMAVFALVGLFVFSLVLAACAPKSAPAGPSAPGAAPKSSGPEAKWPDNIVLGGYPEASDSYPYNVGIAKVISSTTPSKGVVKGYAGSAPILQALGAKGADIIAMNSYDAGKAYFGEAAGFEGKPLDVAMLTYLWPGDMGFAVRPNEGIDKVTDLKGKTITVTSPANPIQDSNKLILQYYKIWDTVKAIPQTGIPQMRDGMINKTLDAFSYSQGAAFELEVQQAVGLKWIPIDIEAIKFAQEQMPGVMATQMVPRNLKMFGMPENTKFMTWAYPYTLMARPDMPDSIVKGLLKAMFDNTTMLSESMYRGSQTTLKSATEIQAHIIPFHPAAVEFYKEKGVWSKQNEDLQKKLLAAPRKRS